MVKLRLTVYAKSHVIRKAQELLKEQKEYKDLHRWLNDVREELRTKSLRFDIEAQELRNSVKNDFEFQVKLRELQRRAKESLEPYVSKIREIKGRIEELTSQLLFYLIKRLVEDDMKTIFYILMELKAEKVEQEKVMPRGKIGRGCVSNVRFDVADLSFKEVSKKFFTTPLKDVEIFLEKL